MAVQAQYLPNTCRNNVLDEFQELQEYQDNPGASLLGGYNFYGGQPIFNGTVFSGPESELTCNVSGSRKRNRNEQIVVPSQNQQRQKFPIENLSTLQCLERTTAISSGLHISEGTSTSGRSASVSEPIKQDLASYLYQQNLEMDTLIRLQKEKLRLVLEETQKRHCSSLLSALEQQVLKRLKDKEIEIEIGKRKNAELEEKIKQISAVNQVWFNAAKNNEAIVLSLRSSLEQFLVQNNGGTKEGLGESDDAESCCYEGTNEKFSEKSCKVCRENEMSVLLLPCRHICMCKDCETKLNSCPICKCVKTASLQIFMA